MDETRGDEDDVREATVTSPVGDACVVSVSVVRRSGDSAGRPEKETATLQVPLAQHVDASLASTDPAGALRDVDALVALAEEKLFVRLLKKQNHPARETTRPRETMEKGNRVRLLTIVIEQTIDRTTSKARDRLSALASTRTARRISPSSRPGALGTKTTTRAASPKIIIQTPRSAGSLTDSTPLARRARPGRPRVSAGKEGWGIPPSGMASRARTRSRAAGRGPPPRGGGGFF